MKPSAITVPHEGNTISCGTCKDSEVVRWYILLYPVPKGRMSAPDPSRRLRMELDSRRRHGEPLFEYFAPACVSYRRCGAKAKPVKSALFFNYVFIRASENQIFALKRVLPQYNLLPRVQKGEAYYYPHLTDAQMEQLKWVSRSYSDQLPLYGVDSQYLVRGDKVRIIRGPLQGMEAEVVKQPGNHHSDVIVRVVGGILVSLYKVTTGDYEVISLSQQGKHQYAYLNNDRYPALLHEALGRFHAHTGLTEADTRLAEEVVLRCANLQLDSDILRCRAYSLLLPAYKILRRDEEFRRLGQTALSMLPLITAQQAKALLAFTLYGCTDHYPLFQQCRQIAEAWNKESDLKKSKRILLQRMADYTRWFGHEK